MEIKKDNLLVFFVSFAAYLAIRFLLLPNVFDGNTLKLLDPDSYYHLRRILFTFENYPEMLMFDPFLSYPEGDFVPWPPLFDFISATFSLPFSNPVYFICGFDLLISVILFLTLYYYNKKQGFISLLFSVLIVSTSLSLVKISSYGNIDHHILEVVFVYSFYLLWLERPFKKIINTILIAVTVCLSFFNWPGAVLYYMPAFIITAWELKKGNIAKANLLGLSLGFLITGVVIEIYFRITGHNVHPYSFKYLSYFQRDICLFLGAALLLFHLYFKKGYKRWLLFIIICIALPLIFNKVFLEIFKGLNYLSKSDESLLMTMVSESTPILFSGKRFFINEFLNMILFFTPFIFLYPFTILNVLRTKKDISLLIVSFYFFIFACIQIRFSIFFMPFFAVLFGQTVGEYLKNVKKRYIISFIGIYYISISSIYFINVKSYLPDDDTLKTMDFLQFKTPLGGEFNAGNTPYGILSSWDKGHYIITLGNRPAAAHNFIAIAKNNKEKEYLKCIFAKKETEVVNIMKKIKTPFLVVSDIEYNLIFGWEVLFEGVNPFFIKKTRNFEPTDKVADLFIYNLMFDMPANNLRLVFESDSLAIKDMKTIAVYECVEGVKILSKEKGIVNVVLKTPYRDVTLVYQPVFHDNSYVFNIPYSNERVYDVYAAEISFVGKKTVNFTFTERDVLFGKTVFVK